MDSYTEYGYNLDSEETRLNPYRKWKKLIFMVGTVVVTGTGIICKILALLARQLFDQKDRMRTRSPDLE